MKSIAGSSINVFGAPGTGKTTLGGALAEKLGVPLLDSDAYFHFPTDPPFTKQRTPEERNRLFREEFFRHEACVVAGNVGGWGIDPRPAFSLTVFLYLPPEIRLARVLERERRLYGARLLPGGDMSHLHREFIEWTNAYDSGANQDSFTLAVHEEYFANLKTPRLRLDTPMATDEQIEIVLRNLLA
jgi:adenylate kinase family enzyme